MNYVRDSKLCAKLVLQRNYHYKIGETPAAYTSRMQPHSTSACAFSFLPTQNHRSFL